MACEQIFLQHLRERGFRLTSQRETILAVLHDVQGLATADELYGRVQSHDASIDISTVYRTLDLLKEFGLVSCVAAADGQNRYELLGIHGPHLHLICQSCGQVIGADPEVAQTFRKRLQAEYGFQAALDQLSVPGLCPACASTRKS
jgi:Fur family ferric uptake transcriptional regulator